MSERQRFERTDLWGRRGIYIYMYIFRIQVMKLFLPATARMLIQSKCFPCFLFFLFAYIYFCLFAFSVFFLSSRVAFFFAFYVLLFAYWMALFFAVPTSPRSLEGVRFSRCVKIRPPNVLCRTSFGARQLAYSLKRAVFFVVHETRGFIAHPSFISLSCSSLIHHSFIGGTSEAKHSSLIGVSLEISVTWGMIPW